MYLALAYSVMKQSSQDDAPKTAVYTEINKLIFIIVQGQSRTPFPNLDPTLKHIAQCNIKGNKRNIKCTALNIRKIKQAQNCRSSSIESCAKTVDLLSRSNESSLKVI